MDKESLIQSPGYMTDEELLCLCELSKGKTVLELGTFLGRSTFNILKTAKTLVTVDNFEGNMDDVCSTVVNQIKQQGSSVWLQFLAHMSMNDKTDGELVIMRMDFERAAHILHDKKFDVVFIDGNHAYGNVKKDIDMFTDFVLQGGILSGHDYDPAIFPGVCKAVNEKFSKPDKVVGSIWIVER